MVWAYAAIRDHDDIDGGFDPRIILGREVNRHFEWQLRIACLAREKAPPGITHDSFGDQLNDVLPIEGVALHGWAVAEGRQAWSSGSR
jgi:hypothetical protein